MVYACLCAATWRAQSWSRYAFLRTTRRSERSWSGCCYYRAGCGLLLPSCRQVVCVELELERLLLLLPYRATPSFALSGGVSGAGAAAATTDWMWSTPSFMPPGGVRGAGAGAAAAATLLDVVYAFLRTARQSARSWSGCCYYRTGCGLRLPSCRQMEAWLKRHAAAADSRGFCWRSQECFAPSPSRVICCRLPDLRRIKSGMERSDPTPTAFRWPCGSGTGGAPAAAAERLRC